MESISRSVQVAILNLAMFTATLSAILIALTLLTLFVTLVAFLFLTLTALLFLCSAYSNISDFLKFRKSFVKFQGSSKKEGLSNLTFQTLIGSWKSTERESTL
jgi:uncharacterized membrane protein